MASYTASVSDGVLIDNGTAYSPVSTTTSSSSSSGSNLEYEQFLQLLCTEMQYQDPLEPATNTEYVAQLATFSQLEATLSLENTLYQQTANDLVGKTVIMRVENSTTGAVSYVDGNVDYVMYEDGETYLSVNDSL
ncbi:MAG: flagellar hook capping protein, partial [Clostridiales bacterium]|nr:flagellar hook capping protein [Clostridiales bacterium]